MAAPFKLNYSSSPHVVPIYARILTSRKPVHVADDVVVPRIEATLGAARIEAARLARYQQICAIEPSATLPIAYPHILATPMHLAMLSSAAFPIRALGLVHLRNRIRQQRPLHSSEAFELRAWLEGHREGDFGQEFDLQTQALVAGEPVWHEVCTFLARRRQRHRREGRRVREPREAAATGVAEPEVRTRDVDVPEQTGRRYGFTSGDINPIHLWHVTARAFGFPKAVAHGMWSLARSAAEFPAATYAEAVELDVSFKQPLFLPARVVFEARSIGHDHAFTLKDAQSGKAHLAGTLKPQFK